MAKKQKAKVKHVPMRTCIVTKDKKPKKKLIRIVREQDGSVSVDIKGKKKGRGANISPDVKFFDISIEKGFLKRALKLRKNLTKSETESLRKEFIATLEEKAFRQGNKPVTIRVKKKDLIKKK